MFHELSKIDFAKQDIPPDVEAGLFKLFEGHKESMISAAISASKRGKHWDTKRPVPMHVGCSMLLLENGFDMSEPKMVTGANKKESPRMLAYPDRMCAEMAAENNALTTRPQFSEDDKKLEKEGEDIQEGDLKKQGFIAAIVTASPSSNTGEVDTKSHDIVHPCKQCQENYKLLLNEKRASPKTIICSVRIDKDKVVSQQFELGELLDKLEKENKEKEENSLGELKAVFDEQMKIFLTSMAPIDQKLKQVRDAIIQKHATSLELSNYLGSLDKERRDEVFTLFDKMEFRLIMGDAIKAVTEEGIPKVKALSVLLSSELIDEVKLERNYPALSKAELESILDVLCNHVLYLSRHPEKLI